MNTLRLWMKKLSRLVSYWLVCRGDKVLYLRAQGARIGENCDIITQAGSFGSEPWLVELGDHVTLAQGVMLVTHDASSRLFRERISGMNPRFGNRYGTIRILDNCFVGINSIILPGVTIGPDSIVGAGSVVTRDVPARSVVAGNPARPICSLEEYIERYRSKMIPLKAETREELRQELTASLWGKDR